MYININAQALSHNFVSTITSYSYKTASTHTICLNNYNLQDSLNTHNFSQQSQLTRHSQYTQFVSTITIENYKTASKHNLSQQSQFTRKPRHSQFVPTITIYKTASTHTKTKALQEEWKKANKTVNKIQSAPLLVLQYLPTTRKKHGSLYEHWAWQQYVPASS